MKIVGTVGNRVEAERELENLLAHVDFELRMGCGRHAETTLREGIADLYEQCAAKDVEIDRLKEYEQEALQFVRDAEEAERERDALVVENDALRARLGESKPPSPFVEAVKAPDAKPKRRRKSVSP